MILASYVAYAAPTTRVSLLLLLLSLLTSEDGSGGEKEEGTKQEIMKSLLLST
jgi:hypothetical protein